MMKKRTVLTVLCLAAAGILCCGCGEKSENLIIGSARESSAESTEAPVEESSGILPSGEICVYVCGAVRNPGVVEVPSGSRAADALAAAGGFGEGAAREAVNLADWVTDGQMLYFPTEEEDREAGAEKAEAEAGIVNINTADKAALCTLPGIGESRARDIISYREANGSFESCEDIMKVPGIKTAAYEKIRDKITVK